MPSFAKAYYLKKLPFYPIIITNQVSYDIQEFPVLISFPTDWIGFQKIKPDGSDIAFLDEANNPLYFYIKRISVPNKILDVIVKIPILRANETITIKTVVGLDPNPYASYHNVKQAYNWVEDFETGTLQNWHIAATSQYPPTIMSDTTMPNKEGTYYARVSRYGESANVGEYTNLYRYLGVPETGRWAVDLLYYLWGKEGYDTRDVVEAQIILGGKTLWRKDIVKGLEEYGELTVEGDVSVNNDMLMFYTWITSVYGGWEDERWFAIDFIRVRKSVDPYPIVEIPNILLGVKDLDTL